MASADADNQVSEQVMTRRYALLHPRPHHATATAMAPPTPLVSAQANPEIVNFLSSTFHKHAAVRFDTRAPSQEMATLRAVVRLADALPTALGCVGMRWHSPCYTGYYWNTLKPPGTYTTLYEPSWILLEE